jgi:geranylgeranyl pyrophosphate synthase
MNCMSSDGVSGEQAFKEAVAARIERSLARGDSAQVIPGLSLERAARRLLLSSRAKRARGVLCAAMGRHIGAHSDAVLDCAAAIELVHGASLLHDDVVDEADVRRGEATARAEGGNAFAVLCGDLVLARALGLLSVHGAACVDATVAVVDEMTRAALLEVEDRGRVDVPQERWETMAMGKTGALFGLCATLPALTKKRGAPSSAFEVERTARLERAMRWYGVAFQIVDDILDLQGGDPGKPRGQDVREKNPSLAILMAVNNDPELGRAVLRYAPDGGDGGDERLFALCDQLLEAGRAQALERASECIAKAQQALGDDAHGLAEVVAWATALVQQSVGAAAALPLPASSRSSHNGVLEPVVNS